MHVWKADKPWAKSLLKTNGPELLMQMHLCILGTLLRKIQHA